MRDVKVDRLTLKGGKAFCVEEFVMGIETCALLFKGCMELPRGGLELLQLHSMAMAARPTPCPALGECCSVSSAVVSTALQSASPSCSGNSPCFKSIHVGNKLVVVRQYQSVYRSSQVSLLRSGLHRCSSVSDDAQASTSQSPPATPPSAPDEAVEKVDRDGEFRREQLEELQQQRPKASRRKADSTDWITSSLTRRFGLAGGLAWVGFLAFGVVSEQVKTRTEVSLESQGTQNVENATEVVLDNDVKYVELRTGGGSSPLRGDLVLVDVTGKVRSTGEVFLDTTSAGSQRPLAFVFGLKPYPRGVCYGLEYVLQSMKAGGKRRVTVPADKCFGETGEVLGNATVVPGGADIEYEVQLQRVSIAPS